MSASKYKYTKKKPRNSELPISVYAASQYHRGFQQLNDGIEERALKYASDGTPLFNEEDIFDTSGRYLNDNAVVNNTSSIEDDSPHFRNDDNLNDNPLPFYVKDGFEHQVKSNRKRIIGLKGNKSLKKGGHGKRVQFNWGEILGTNFTTLNRPPQFQLNENYSEQQLLKLQKKMKELHSKAKALADEGKPLQALELIVEEFSLFDYSDDSDIRLEVGVLDGINASTFAITPDIDFEDEYADAESVRMIVHRDYIIDALQHGVNGLNRLVHTLRHESVHAKQYLDGDYNRPDISDPDEIKNMEEFEAYASEGLGDGEYHLMPLRKEVRINQMRKALHHYDQLNSPMAKAWYKNIATALQSSIVKLGGSLSEGVDTELKF